MVKRLAGWQIGKRLVQCLVVLGIGFCTPVWADVQAGLDWLTAQAQPDGSYVTPTALATPVQATSETLRTLRVPPTGSHPSVLAARQFLAAEPWHLTEYLARQLIARADAAEDLAGLVGDLLSRQNLDGGFGDLAGYDSTVLDTVFALEALAATGHNDTAITAPAVQFLVSRQLPDGGWTDGAKTASVYLTALALRALWLYRHTFILAPALEAAQTLLLGQRTNGGWNETFETALALIAILPRLGDLAPVADSLTALDHTQHPNGSWDDDVYTTALVLRTLALARTPAPNPDLGTLSGRVADGDTGTTLPGVTATLSGTVNASLVTDSHGAFQFYGLPAGDYTLALSLTDYSTVTTLTHLPTSGRIDFGALILLKNLDAAATGTIRGIVTDAETHTPLAGVRVTAGDHTAVSGSDGGYQISNAAPGQVTVTARLDGYTNASGSAELTAGGVLVFSPALSAIGSTPPETPDSGITGIVLDATTDEPLAGVTVQVMHGTVTEEVTTTGDGRLAVDAISDAEVRLQFTLEGYTAATFSLPTASISLLDIGQVRLRPATVQALQADLTIASVEAQSALTDPHTLALSGVVRVTIHNQGTHAAVEPFVVLAFDDLNRNDRFDPDLDQILGSAAVADGLALDTQTPVTIAVAGALPFRDAPISVWVDSAQSIVELDEGNNITTSSSRCLTEPVRGTMEPVVKWAWSGSPVLPAFDQVMSLPVVIPLEDTNGDGRIDQRDTPSVIFHAFASSLYRGDGVLRAVSGADGRELWTVVDPAYRTNPLGSIAAADLDGDGRVEIIVPKDGSGLLVFEHDGQYKWSSDIPAGIRVGGAAVADLDGDGTPEIIVGTTVLNADGSLRWQEHGYTGGNSFGILSVVADLDLDGLPEVIAGASAYTNDGQLLWQNDSVGDGYVAMGNFDTTPTPEIVVVYRGRVYLLDAQGHILWGPVYLPGGGWGGPPTVADMDGDARPEIGIAGARRYTVLDTDGSLLWAVPTQDASSQITGSSVFDFDGDGQAEVVYADEHYLRIYRGIDGQELFAAANSSGTASELPVIADVDNDDHADIVVCANNYAWGSNTGIRVFTNLENNWVNTRRIWNQHTYHITNIDDDGTVPALEEPSWLGPNTYRLNAFPDRSPLASADLSVAVLEAVDHGTNQPLSLRVRVGNGGALTPSQSVTVAFYQGTPGTDGGVLLGTVELPQVAGQSYQDVQLDGVSLSGSDPLYAVVDPDDDIAECDESNNVVASPIDSAAPLGSIAVATDTMVYGPDSLVFLTTTVTNTGSLAAAYEIRFRITDGGGAPVSTLPPLPVGPLAGGSSETLHQNWNTGTTLAGSYVLVGTLYDRAGNLLDEATSVFLIEATTTAQASLRLTHDRAIYHTTDTVTLTALARNLTSNLLLPGAVVEINVLTPGGATVYGDTLTVGDLAPGARREITTAFALQSGPEGRYTSVARLQDAHGTRLASTQTAFEVVENLRLALDGSVAVQDAAIEAGDTQVCINTVTNHGTRHLSAQPIRRLVVGIESEFLATDINSTVELAPGTNQTLVQGIETASLPAGNYACVLQARINETWQTLTTAVFTVREPPFELSAELTLGARGRVLVLLDNPNNISCRPDDGDNCSAPHGSAEIPTLLEQQIYLEVLLAWTSWTYTVVTDADTFTAEFRSGGYSTYVVLAEQIKLAEQVQGELREAVYRGEGLIVAGDHDQRHGRLAEPLGLTFRGKTPQAIGVKLQNSTLHPEAQDILLISDMVHKVELTGATAVGSFQVQGRRHDAKRAGSAAVTVRDYGAGRAVFMGFDVLAEATLAGQEGVFTSLLLHALDYVQPVVPATIPGAVVPVSLAVHSQGAVPPVQAVLTIPLEAHVVAAEPTMGTIDAPAEGELIWSVELATDAHASLVLWLRLSDAPGPVDVAATLLLGAEAAFGEHGSFNLTFDIEPRPGLDAALVDLDDLVTWNQDYRQAQQRLEQADRAFAREDDSAVLAHLVRTAEALLRVGTPEAEQVRYAVAEALRQVAQWLVDF